ncbi:MAG: hypothetical protein KAX09_07765 [Candidatus Heimdallarchaeota archaeon]|nr:hypothetical protein [Candidatus Heimdallarchaeota archaeon]MCK4290866.1 hypothetical protein [Candidatus Heimdallarchaeota archaeon]
MRKIKKLNKSNMTTILIVIVFFSLFSFQKDIPKAESIDPMFTLDAICYKIKHLDYLNLIKQQLIRIGINLEIRYVNLTEICFLGGLIAFRDFDLEIIEFPCSNFDNPFTPVLYSENGSLNLAGYRTSIDWDTELGTGRNEWYIQTGSQMEPNDSQARINLCWEWQHYMMDELLPILPLFTQKNNRSSYEIIIFNMREVRPFIGSRIDAPGYPEKTLGLVVRKIISYAINREEIRRVVLGDDYVVIHHPINPFLDDWLSPNSIRYCYNLKAVGILKTIAGFDIAWCGPIEPISNWPSWEEFCPVNLTSVNVSGFNSIIALSSISILSVCFLSYQRRKKKS